MPYSNGMGGSVFQMSHRDRRLKMATEKITIEDLQGDVPDIMQDVRFVFSDLENAECCDNKEDFCENLQTALSNLLNAKKEIERFLKLAKKCSEDAE
jgi:hypothetical protein